MKNILKAWFCVLSVAFSCSLPGCLSEDDGAAVEPDFGSGRISLSELRKIPAGTLLSDDIAVTATVISDPAANNLPPGCFFVQDNSCRGICIAMDGAAYARGDRLQINVRNASVEVNDDGLYLLSGLSSENIVLLSSGDNPESTPIKANELSDYESMFVRIDQAQVTLSDQNKPFSGKLNFETEYGRRFSVYTDGSAGFASSTVPADYGYIEGIVSLVDGKRVLLPVNPSSYAHLTEDRCTPPTPQFSVPEVRDMDEGTVPDDIEMTATVVSDGSDANFDDRTAYVQDAERGVMIEFTAPHGMAAGQNFTLNLKGTTVSAGQPFRITGVDPAQIVKNGNPQEVNPVQVTLAQLTKDDTYESMLVQVTNIQSAENDASKTFSENTLFTDSEGSQLSVYTAPGSVRRTNHVPPAAGSVAGIVTATGKTPRLTPRTNADFSLPDKGTRFDGTEVIFFVPDDTQDLFLSEAVHGVAADGQSINAVELYNPTGSPLDLTQYMLVLLFHDSNTDLITSVAKLTFENANDFPRALSPGETLVIVSETATAMPDKFDKTRYSYYKEYNPSSMPVLGSKGNAPFVLMKNTGSPSVPSWTEIDRVGVPNVLDASKLKPGETDIDSYSGKYSSNPAAASKLERGWNRGRTWTRNPGYAGRPGNANQLTEATLNKGSWSALADKKAQYKLDIANTACDPRTSGSGWTQVSINSATSATSAKQNTTLGWHIYSIPMTD